MVDLSSLPEPLRTKLEQKLQRQPELEAVIAKLMIKRATSPEDRELVDRLLTQAVSPSYLLWAGLAVVVCAALVVFISFAHGKYKTEQALKNGTLTVARVERLAPGRCLFGGDDTRCLTLGLKLFPTGGAPYEGELTENIDMDWLARVQPGEWLFVAVDKGDQQKVTLDTEAFQRPPPSPLE